MDFSATVESKVLRDKLGSLTDALIGSGQMGDAAKILSNEFRTFLKRVMPFTPPKTRKQGEEAGERDLNKIFTPVNDEFLNMVGSQFGVSGIDTWITGKDDKKMHLQWDRLDPSGEGMEAFHKANRNARGRTRKLKRGKGDSWYAPYVVSTADLQSYLDKIKSRVGRRKAGWAVALLSVGGNVSEWIMRHVSTAPGEVLNNLSGGGNHPSITVTNRAPGIRDDERIVRDAMRITLGTLQKKIRYILRGYKYDWDTGRVIRPKEMQEAA